MRFSAIPKDKHLNKPAKHTSAPRLQARLRTIYIILAICVVSGPLAVVIAFARGGNEYVPPPAPPSAQGMATIIATTYLNGDSLPLSIPIAKGLSQNLGHSTYTPATSTPDEPPPSTIPAKLNYLALDFETVIQAAPVDEKILQIYRFRVLTEANIFYLDVPLAFLGIPGGGHAPILSAYPTITPVSDVAPGVVDVIDYTAKNIPNDTNNMEVITRLIKKWATTYTSGTAEELADLGGTKDTSQFIPLQGFTTDPERVKVQSAAVVNKAYRAYRVNMPLISGEYTVSASYDLLIKTPDTDPKIVAWGPPTSINNLTDWTLGAAPSN